MYLTLDEYNAYDQFDNATADNFNKLSAVASDLVDAITKYHYVHHPILEDKDSFRRESFLKAVGAQINYMIENKATTSTGMNSTPQSVSIGRTTVHQGGQRSSTTTEKPMISPDAMNYLYATGFLYSGMGSY